jgi:hypothetical protein
VKRLLFLLPVIVLAFLAFHVIQNRALSEEDKGEAKKQTITDNKPATPAKQQSPYVNGKALLTESSFDFGYCPVSSTLYHPFYIRNVGSDTLDIVDIKPG